MIVECPHCKAAHSKAERDAVLGATMTCRRCAKTFTIDSSGGTAGDATSDAEAKGERRASRPALSMSEESTVKPARRASADIPVTEFHQASTQITKVPAGVKRAAEPARPDLVVPPSVSTVGQIREMLDRMKSDDGAAAIEEPAVAPSVPVTSDTDAVTQSIAYQHVPSGMEPEASVPGTGLFFDDEPPVANKVEALAATEASRRLPDGVLGWPSFPFAAVGTWARGIGTFVMAQRAPLKLGLLAGSSLLVVLLVVGLVLLLLPSPPTILYVDDTQALMVGPGVEAVFPKVGEVQRGEPVTVFERGGFGSWVMVQDFLGRVGYVSSEALSPYRPLSRAGTPFVACKRSAIEPDPESCHSRGQAQFDSCRDACASEANEAACLEQCQRQLTSCILGCEGKPAPAEAPGGIEGTPSGASTEAGAEPIADHDKGAKKPSKAPKKPKRPRKK